MGTGVQAYISYRVITKTNLPDFEGQEKIVIRRYSDFEWLHDRLAEKYKGIFIPPLPEKNAVEKFRFSKEFIELRRQALDLFVNRIASHPELKQSGDLKIFLQADEEKMDRERSYETGIFKKPSDFLQMFKDVQSKVSDVVLGKEKPVEESSPEYEKLKNYIFELENHLAEAQKQAFRLVKRHRELGQSLADFGKAIKLLGACEGDSLEKVFSEVGSKSEMLSVKLQREADNLLFNFEEPLKDYVRAVQSIKATMVDRANAFRQHHDLFQQKEYKGVNLEKLKFVNPDKFSELEAELTADSEEATKRFEHIVAVMNEELARFQEQKTADIGFAFHEFAKGQAKLAKDIADAWRGGHRERQGGALAEASSVSNRAMSMLAGSFTVPRLTPSSSSSARTISSFPAAARGGLMATANNLTLDFKPGSLSPLLQQLFLQREAGRPLQESLWTSSCLTTAMAAFCLRGFGLRSGVESQFTELS
uniref:PX domain-containing protein n=1 Tax=Oryza nivara TaxID=4536 RepID=A0A0E0FW15_ORYNI